MVTKTTLTSRKVYNMLRACAYQKKKLFFKRKYRLKLLVCSKSPGFS